MLFRRDIPVGLLRRSAMGVLAVVVAVTLAACTAEEAAPSASPSASSDAETTAPVEPAAPSYHPDGTAEDNLPIFTAVTDQVWATEQRAEGRAYIDALVAAGFDRSQMQVTEDLSTVGNPAESLQFSVRWGDSECLIGQVGPSTGDPVTAVMDQLSEGRCLIGTTRPIDW